MPRPIYFLICFFVLTMCSFNAAQAQDTLPRFNAYKRAGNQAEISWTNDYGVVKQITVQRSTDSLKRFASVFSSPNPMAKRGVYLDAKTNGYQYYYRVFVQLPDGVYFHTPSQKAVIDSSMIGLDGKPLPSNIKDDKGLKPPVNGLTPKPLVFVPSDHVFSDKKGNIIINLPGAENKKYSIVFKDENEREVLRIKHVKESNLILERTNFYKSGWYFFEIYDGETLFEKHKVQLGVGKDL